MALDMIGGIGMAGFGLLGMLFMLFQVALYVLGIYFLVTAIQFMKNKQRTDEELIRKIDVLIGKKGEL